MISSGKEEVFFGVRESSAGDRRKKEYQQSGEENARTCLFPVFMAAEDFHSRHNKDVYVLKPLKPTPLMLRTVMFTIAMICGVYTCSICVRQLITVQTGYSVEVIQGRRPSSSSSSSESLHLPRPKTFSRGECEANPVRFFVIVSMQRSGSGWFETLLNSHLNVSSNGEIFSVPGRRQNVSSIVGTLDKVYNLDWFTSASKNECSAAVGFKWMLNQGLMDYHTELSDYFTRRGVSVIFLFRRNLLRRKVSLLANSYDGYAKQLNGTHKSHVHSQEEADVLSRYKPFINSTSLVSELKEMESTASKALEYLNSTRHITLYYEDLVKNETKVVEVVRFLKLPMMKLTSRQVKIHRGDLREHIRNWEEVRRTLNGTVYERFLVTDNY